MALRYVPSGATPNYLKALIRLNPDGSLHSVDRLVEQLDDPNHPDWVREQGQTPVWLGPYSHPDNMLAGYSPWWMTNPVDLQALDPMRDGSYRQFEKFAEAGGVRLWSDSGGWPIKSGVRDWVDPRRVIEFYLQCAHRGMALDIPPRRDQDVTRFFLDGLAQAQSKNNAVMLAGKRPDLELINVLHGNRLDHQRLWVDRVISPGFMGWATALDTDLPDPIVGVEGIAPIRGSALLFHEYGHRTGIMHLFGMSGQAMVPVAAWLGRFFPELTSDSTSWIPKDCSYALNRDGKLTSIRYGKNVKGRLTDPLPCRCEFCRLIGTFGRMQDENGNAVRPLVAAHNIVTIMAVVDYWNELARTLDFPAYREAFKKRVVQWKEAVQLLDYANDAMELGPALADLEFGKHKKAFSLAS